MLRPTRSRSVMAPAPAGTVSTEDTPFPLKSGMAFGTSVLLMVVTQGANVAVGVGVRVGVQVGVGVCVLVGVRVGVRVGPTVGVQTPARVKRSPQALSVPPSMATWSIVVSVQTPLGFWPLKALSRLAGR